MLAPIFASRVSVQDVAGRKHRATASGAMADAMADAMAEERGACARPREERSRSGLREPGCEPGCELG